METTQKASMIDSFAIDGDSEHLSHFPGSHLLASSTEALKRCKSQRHLE